MDIGGHAHDAPKPLASTMVGDQGSCEAQSNGWQRLGRYSGLTHWHLAAAPGAKTATLGASIRVATAAFDDSGASHALEHWLLRGNLSYPEPEGFFRLRSSQVYQEFNASTGPLETHFHLAADSADTALLLLDYLLSAVLLPCLRDSDFNIEVDGVMAREMRGYMDNADFALAQKIGAGHHPLYGGSPECIARLSPDKLRRCWRYWYRPERMQLFTTGSWSQASLTRLIEDTLSRYHQSADGLSFDLPSPDFARYIAPPHHRVLLAADMVTTKAPGDFWQALEILLADEFSTRELAALGWRWLKENLPEAYRVSQCQGQDMTLVFVPLAGMAPKTEALDEWLKRRLQSLGKQPVLAYWSAQGRLIKQLSSCRKLGPALTCLYESQSPQPAAIGWLRLCLNLSCPDDDSADDDSVDDVSADNLCQEQLRHWLIAAKAQFNAYCRAARIAAKIDVMSSGDELGLHIQAFDTDIPALEQSLFGLLQLPLTIASDSVEGGDSQVSPAKSGTSPAAIISAFERDLLADQVGPRLVEKDGVAQVNATLSLSSLIDRRYWRIDSSLGGRSRASMGGKILGPAKGTDRRQGDWHWNSLALPEHGMALIGIRPGSPMGVLPLLMLSQHLQAALVDARAAGRLYGAGHRLIGAGRAMILFTAQDQNPQASLSTLEEWLARPLTSKETQLRLAQALAQLAREQRFTDGEPDREQATAQFTQLLRYLASRVS